MSEVLKFPGAKSPEDVLKDVIDVGVKEFALAGVGKENTLFFATSGTDKAEILLLLEAFKFQLMSGQLDEY